MIPNFIGSNRSDEGSERVCDTMNFGIPMSELSFKSCIDDFRVYCYRSHLHTDYELHDDGDLRESIILHNTGEAYFRDTVTIGDGIILKDNNNADSILLNADGTSSFKGNMFLKMDDGTGNLRNNIYLSNNGNSSFRGNMTIGYDNPDNTTMTIHSKSTAIFNDCSIGSTGSAFTVNSVTNMNNKVTIKSTNGDILNVKNNFDMSVLHIANDENVKIQSGLEVGIMGSDQNLIINCSTQINKNTVIGTQANNKSLTINGDLTVYGNIRCTGNLRCTGTGHFDNFICDNDTRLHQTPDRDIEVGSFFNQITAEFDNFIADINI
jgi:hypothetical protein